MNEEQKQKIKKNNLSFGEAFVDLRYGHKIAREGWNGKDMFLIRAGGYTVPKDQLREGTPINANLLTERGIEQMDILPHVDMWTAQNKYLVGWVPSQIDMFANDWYILD